jgi:hypothetical protein
MPLLFWIIFAFLLIIAIVPDARARELGRLVESIYAAADREQLELVAYVKAHRQELIDQLRSQGFAVIPHPDGVHTIRIDRDPPKNV